METLLAQFVGWLQGTPDFLVVMLIAMVPIFELRGSIPVAMGVFHFSAIEASIYSIIGNMVPAFLVLFGWEWIMSMLASWFPAVHRFMDRYHEGLHQKWQASIDRHGPWALALFVAIPLPLSGVWSGALVAWLFGIHRKQALLAIFIGVCVAAAIVSTLPFFYAQIFSQGR